MPKTFKYWLFGMPADATESPIGGFGRSIFGTDFPAVSPGMVTNFAAGGFTIDSVVFSGSADVVVEAAGGVEVGAVDFGGAADVIVGAAGGFAIESLVFAGSSESVVLATGGFTIDPLVFSGLADVVVPAAGGVAVDPVVFAGSSPPTNEAVGTLVIDSVTFAGAGTGGGPVTLRQALCSILGAVPGLSDSVGERIYFNGLPQSLRPILNSVSYVVSARSHGYHLGGGNGISSASVRVSCWSTLQADAEAMAASIRNALHGFRGRVGSVEFLGFFLEDETDLPENPTDGSAVFTQQIVLTFTVIHRVQPTPIS